MQYALFIVTETPVDIWRAALLAGPQNKPKGDVLVALGSAQLRDGIMDESSYSRAVGAVHAWRQDGFKMIILSGGGPPGHAAAEGMGDFLVAQGIPPKSIRLETLCRSTHENALFTKPLLEAIPGRKVLLTSDAHIYRARRTFQQLGLKVLPWPCPDVVTQAQNPLGGRDALAGLATETGKIGYYYL